MDEAQDSVVLDLDDAAPGEHVLQLIGLLIAVIAQAMHPVRPCRPTRPSSPMRRHRAAWLTLLLVLVCRISICASPHAAVARHAVVARSSSDVVAVLRSRGLVQEVTSEELGKVAAAERLSVYCGFDPTADSLHLGNLLGIIVLAWFQRCGHQPVALLGGATGRVGDPSGRSTERPVLSEEEIEGNVRGEAAMPCAPCMQGRPCMRAAEPCALTALPLLLPDFPVWAAIGRLMNDILQRNSPEGSNSVTVVNNLDWFKGISFLSFLRDVGKYARVGTMMAKDSVSSEGGSGEGEGRGRKKPARHPRGEVLRVLLHALDDPRACFASQVRTRMESEQGISFTEFTYQLLQVREGRQAKKSGRVNVRKVI